MLKTSQGRSAATVRSSGLRARCCRFLLAALLAGAAIPALADPTTVAGPMSGDSADAPAPAARGVLPESMTLSDRALLLATDINRLLGPADAKAKDAKAAKADAGVRSVLQRALALLGTPYRWGGTSPDSGFDCSGLVGYVFRNALGIELPRVSKEMAKTGELVADRSKLAEGDLVFFGDRGVVDHVGIYLGNGRFVHAPRTGRDVTVSSLDTGYWSGKYMEARRVADL